MKQKILEKATDMFLNYGFKSVTMDDIANGMGISKKTIYAHYANKTKLVNDSTANLLHTISSGIDTIRALEKNPIAELYEIKKLVMLHLKDEKSSPQYQLQKYYPKVFGDMKNRQFEIMYDCVIDNLEKGIAKGIYRANMNVEFVARIYFSGVTSIKDQTLFPLVNFPISELMDDYLEYHLRGIVTPAGKKIVNEIINSNQE